MASQNAFTNFHKMLSQLDTTNLQNAFHKFTHIAFTKWLYKMAPQNAFTKCFPQNAFHKFTQTCTTSWHNKVTQNAFAKCFHKFGFTNLQNAFTTCTQQSYKMLSQNAFTKWFYKFT